MATPTSSSATPPSTPTSGSTRRPRWQGGAPNKNPIKTTGNVYGYTIGGPIFIPNHYNNNRNKTFFFWAEEWRKLSTPGGDTFAAASQAMLNGVVPGNFTNAPAGCTTFDAASNTTTISSSCYSANSQVYLTNVFDKFPANDGNFYTFSSSNLNNFRDDIVRYVDHYFNDKAHFYARYMNDDMPVDQPEGPLGRLQLSRPCQHAGQLAGQERGGQPDLDHQPQGRQ